MAVVSLGLLKTTSSSPNSPKEEITPISMFFLIGR